MLLRIDSVYNALTIEVAFVARIVAGAVLGFATNAASQSFAVMNTGSEAWKSMVPTLHPA